MANFNSRARIKRNSSVSASLPAPYGGWNARDSEANMEATDALDMVNWFPGTSDVMVRKGYSQFSTGIGANVQSLMVYNGPSSSKMFSAANTSIYDSSSSGAVGAAAVTGLGNVRFQYVNVTTSGGSYLIACNGQDSVYSYDGSAWANPAITGVTSADLIHVNLFKNRLWFTEINSLSAWYLPTNAIAGAAQEFPLASIAQLGGYLVGMATWTIDAGWGVDDIAVFITSEGEVIAYRGTDPSSSALWALAGVWQIGSPIGRRCFIKYKGDLLIITYDGVVPLSGILQSSRVNPRVSITDKIRYAMNEATVNYGGNFGWELMVYPKANMLILNVPVSQFANQQQYVANTITRNWGQFQGWSANCWALYNDDIYFGSNGYVGKAWDTYADNSADISYDCRQAFNYFGSHGQMKRWTMMRPIINTDGEPAILANVNVDFEDTEPTSSISFAPNNYATWDSGIWDTGIWGGGLQIQKNWQGVTGVGYCAAPRLKGLSSGIDVRWVATDLVMEPGAIL